MTSDTPRPDDKKGRVVPFARRGKGRPRTTTNAPSGDEAIEDVGKYARGQPDNYRQRMTNNVLAFGFCILLVAVGIWLANTIAEMRRNQDCVLSGRRNCANVSVPVEKTE